MTLIKVEKKDMTKVFGILLHNGKFSGVGENKFILYENAESILSILRNKKIKYTIL